MFLASEGPVRPSRPERIEEQQKTVRLYVRNRSRCQHAKSVEMSARARMGGSTLSCLAAAGGRRGAWCVSTAVVVFGQWQRLDRQEKLHGQWAKVGQSATVLYHAGG